jgi:hypothetical protein
MPDGDWSREQSRTVFVRSRAHGTEALTLRYRVRAHSAVFVIPPPPPPPASVAAINSAAAAAKLAKQQRQTANSNSNSNSHPSAEDSASAIAAASAEGSLDFGSALCNQPVLRTLALHNKAPHAMPFEIVCSHAAEFTAVPRAGVLECGQSVDIRYGRR